MELPFKKIQVPSIRMKESEVLALKGYTIPKNFPNDTKLHTEMLKELNEWYKKFPNCCSNCQRLAQESWFKKEDFDTLTIKIMGHLSVTEHCISIAINRPDWYGFITDYIGFNIIGLGNPAVGDYQYRHLVKYYIREIAPTQIQLEEDKKNKLLEYLDNLDKPSPIVNSNTDPNQLFLLFQKWLEAIPDLEFFKGFKNRYKGKAPNNLIFEVVKANRFTNLTKMRIREPKEFIDKLVGFTKELLHSAETKKVLTKGLITDIEQHQVNLMFEAHTKQQIQNLQVDYTEDEFQYINIMTTWLKSEEAFFQQNEKLLKSYLDKNKQKNTSQTPNQKLKELTLLALFKHNQENLDKFFLLLKNENTEALDESNTWIYNSRKSSIVACFQALEDLDKIKKLGNKAVLRRCIESEINLTGNEKLFRNPFDDTDYKEFLRLFEKNL